MRPLVVVLLAAASPFAAGSSLEQPSPMSLTSVYRDLSYVRDGGPRQRLDLFVPTPPVPRVWEQPLLMGAVTLRVPVIVWIHGGAWIIGRKKDTVPLEWLALGYAVASVDYRLSSDATLLIRRCDGSLRIS